MEDRVTVVTDAQGSVIGYQGVARDITDRRELEGHLIQSQKMEAIGQLAGGVAPDFNNLLTGLIGMAALVMARMSQQDPSYSDLREVRLAADRATGLTRQLLAFSRKQILQPEVINLNAIVGNLLAMLGRLIGEDIQLKFIPAPDLGSVRADPGQLEQSLVNLAV